MRVPPRNELWLAAAVLLGSAVLFGWLRWVAGTSSNGWLLAGSALTAAVCVALLTLSLLVLTHPQLRTSVILGPGVLASIIGFSLAAIGGGALLALATHFAARSISLEANSRRTYRARFYFARAARLLVVGVLAAAAGLSLPALTSSVANTRVEVRSEHIAPFLEPLSPLIQQVLPQYATHKTVDELLVERIAAEIGNTPGAAVPDAELQRIVTQGRTELARQLNQPLSGAETLPDIVAGVLNRYVQRALATTPLLASLVLIALVFLAVRALIPFIVWPLLGLIAGMVYVARRWGVVTVVAVPTTVEQVQLAS